MSLREPAIWQTPGWWAKSHVGDAHMLADMVRDDSHQLLRWPTTRIERETCNAEHGQSICDRMDARYGQHGAMREHGTPTSPPAVSHAGTLSRPVCLGIPYGLLPVRTDGNVLAISEASVGQPSVLVNVLDPVSLTLLV
jgi:hypothetical protein